MPAYRLLVTPAVREYVASLDEKSARIVRENLDVLTEHPYPGRGRGDKEAIVFEGREVFRLHVGRSHTAIYTVHEDAGEVRVRDVLPIDEAHDRYGWG